MNKNVTIAVIVVIVLLIGGSIYFKNSSRQLQDQAVTEEDLDREAEIMDNENAIAEDDPNKEENNEAEGEDEENATFELKASNFKYDVKEIRVKKGSKVKVVLTIEEGNHDFVVDEFGVKTNQLTEGQSDTVEFLADKVGTFEYYCSVLQHRKMGMVGKLIVE